MDQSYNQKSYLIDKITKAFKDVVLEDGVSLHETIKIDNYWADDALEALIQKDERKDWQKLVNDPELKAICGIGGICFYDEKGLKFHLPAYMCLAINAPEAEVTHSLIFALIKLDDYQKKRLSILNVYQRRAVKAFLQYYRHNTGWKSCVGDGSEIERVIKEYWDQE